MSNQNVSLLIYSTHWEECRWTHFAIIGHSQPHPPATILHRNVLKQFLLPIVSSAMWETLETCRNRGKFCYKYLTANQKTPKCSQWQQQQLDGSPKCYFPCLSWFSLIQFEILPNHLNHLSFQGVLYQNSAFKSPLYCQSWNKQRKYKPKRKSWEQIVPPHSWWAEIFLPKFSMWRGTIKFYCLSGLFCSLESN